MNKEMAISVIESCSGFTDETTCAGEAWEYIRSYMAQLEEALKTIEFGYEQRVLAPLMNGTFQMVPHLLERQRMREIAAQALSKEV